MNSALPQEVIRIGQIEVRYLLEGTDTNGTLALFECTIPPNVRVPAPHRHEAYDETIWGITGTCTFVVEVRELALAPGQALFISRGAAHQFVNRGSETVRFLAAVTPGVLSPDYFREVGAVVTLSRSLGRIIKRRWKIRALCPPSHVGLRSEQKLQTVLFCGKDVQGQPGAVIGPAVQFYRPFRKREPSGVFARSEAQPD